ncbi:MAG TPA: hypothetical protein VFZ27_16680 [Terriglobia bacterium]|nr:hypothetical protein [Terriglobia bacterium]
MLAASFSNLIPFCCGMLGAGDVRLMRRTVGTAMGGIWPPAGVMKMLEAGAGRPGADASAAILAEAACLAG